MRRLRSLCHYQGCVAQLREDPPAVEVSESSCRKGQKKEYISRKLGPVAIASEMCTTIPQIIAQHDTSPHHNSSHITTSQFTASHSPHLKSQLTSHFSPYYHRYVLHVTRRHVVNQIHQPAATDFLAQVKVMHWHPSTQFVSNALVLSGSFA